MKYYNKRKEVRLKCWTRIELPLVIDPWFAPHGIMKLYNSERFKDIKKWCQQHPSKGRFYSGPYTEIEWYFEKPEDALVFKLRWATK